MNSITLPVSDHIVSSSLLYKCNVFCTCCDTNVYEGRKGDRRSGSQNEKKSQEKEETDRKETIEKYMKSTVNVKGIS